MEKGSTENATETVSTEGKKEEENKKADPPRPLEYADQDSTANSLNKYNFIFYFIYKYKYESPGEAFRKLFE